MTIGDIIKKYRELHGLTIDEFVKNSKLTKGYISMLENNLNPSTGKPIKPSVTKTKIIADIMGLSLTEILEMVDESTEITVYEDEKKDNLSQYDNIMPITTKKVPLLGQIACGKPIYANEDRESYIEVGTDIKADFCLKATGDSMINARIFDGDIVFIRKQPTVENGEIAAVIIDDSATLKRVFYHPETDILELKAENPKYPVQTYTNEQLNQIKILGKAIAFQGDVI